MNSSRIRAASMAGLRRLALVTVRPAAFREIHLPGYRVGLDLALVAARRPVTHSFFAYGYLHLWHPQLAQGLVISCDIISRRLSSKEIKPPSNR